MSLGLNELLATRPTVNIFVYADLTLNVPLLQMYFQEDNMEDVRHYKTDQMTADSAFL